VNPGHKVYDPTRHPHPPTWRLPQPEELPGGQLISGELRLPAALLEELAAQPGVPDVEKILERAI